jgi:hypothetical protein
MAISYNAPDTCPKLMSYERNALAHFILQTRETREDLLDAARRDPKTSGALVAAYRWALTA